MPEFKGRLVHKAHRLLYQTLDLSVFQKDTRRVHGRSQMRISLDFRYVYQMFAKNTPHVNGPRRKNFVMQGYLAYENATPLGPP